jgi:FkbM family methyltransferase
MRRVFYLIGRELKRLRQVGPVRFFLWELWLLLTTYIRYRRDLTLFLRLGGKQKAVIKDVQGSRMHLDMQDRGISRDLAFDGVRERLSTEAIQSELKPGSVVVDIGANIGYYALMEARLVGPEGRVYAIEPVPRTREVLEHNIALNSYSNIETFPFAMGHQTCKGAIYVPPRWNHASLVPPHGAGPPETVIRIDVDVLTVDDFMKGKRWPDLIRMDVEGYEYHILQGMKGMLASGRPLSLFIELHSVPTTRALLMTLKEFGFKAKKVINDGAPPMLIDNHMMKRVVEFIDSKRLGHDMKYGCLDLTLDDLLNHAFIAERKFENIHIWLERS